MQKMKVTFWQNVARVCTLCMAALAVVGLCLCTTVKPSNAAAGESTNATIIELTGTDEEMLSIFTSRASQDSYSRRPVLTLTKDWTIPTQEIIKVEGGSSYSIGTWLALDLNGYTVTNASYLYLKYTNLEIFDSSAAQTGKWINKGENACFFIDPANDGSMRIYGGTICTDNGCLAMCRDDSYAVVGLMNGRLIMPENASVVTTPGQYIGGDYGWYIYQYGGSCQSLDDVKFRKYGGEILYGNYEEILAELNKPAEPEQPDPVEPTPDEPTPTEPTQPETPTTPTVKGDDGKVNVGAIAGGVSAAAVVVLGGVTAGVVTVLKRKQ